MKTALRTLGWIILICILLTIIFTVYSTAKGYMTWYFRVDGTVEVNGERTSGYLHANTQRSVLLITRTDEHQPETYLVVITSPKSILDCGAWHPVRFLPTPIRDLNSTCSYTNPTTVMDAPVPSSLIFSRRFVEFSTASGKKIKAEW